MILRGLPHKSKVASDGHKKDTLQYTSPDDSETEPVSVNVKNKLSEKDKERQKERDKIIEELKKEDDMRKSFARRNTESDIAAARARYMMRKQKLNVDYESDSD